jgi:hypothetical protein
MIAVRLDPRLQGRFDPSDVLQETYLDAFGRLPEYLRELPHRLPTPRGQAEWNPPPW